MADVKEVSFDWLSRIGKYYDTCLWRVVPEGCSNPTEALDCLSLWGLIFLQTLVDGEIPTYVVLRDGQPYFDVERFKACWHIQVANREPLIKYMREKGFKLVSESFDEVAFSKQHQFSIQYMTDSSGKVYKLKHPIPYNTKLTVYVNTEGLFKLGNYTIEDIRQAHIAIRLDDCSHPHVSGAGGLLCTGDYNDNVALLDNINKVLETVNLSSMYGFRDRFIEKLKPELEYLASEHKNILPGDVLIALEEGQSISSYSAKQAMRRAVSKLGREIVLTTS